MEERVTQWRAGLARKKTPQAIRLELCSISRKTAGAGPRDLSFEVGSRAWDQNSPGGPLGGLARDGESAAPR